MHIDDLVKNRRAVPPRFFNNKQVPDELVWQLLENANWAPNHKQTEPWRFRVYKSESKAKMTGDVRDLLLKNTQAGALVNPANIDKFIGNLEKSAVVIILHMQHDEARRIPEWEEVAASACAVQNMWLTATSLGLSAFWSTPAFMDRLCEYFDITENQKFLGFFFLGYSDLDYPSPGRSPVSLKVEWMKE